MVLSVSARDEVAVKKGRFLGQRWWGRREEGRLARVIFSVRVLPGDRVAILEAQEIGKAGPYRFAVSLVDRAGKRTVLSPGWRYWWNLSWSAATRET